MQSDIEIFPIFPSSFCTIMLPEMVAKFWEEETPNIKFFLPDEDASVWQTERDVLDNYLEMKELFRQISEDWLKELGYNQKIKIKTSWLKAIENGDTSSFHRHTNSWYSCVYYFHDSCSDLILIGNNRRDIDVVVTKGSIHTRNTCTISPQKNQFIIFPSYLYHQITKNTFKETRHSLAFNIMPSGKVGHADSTVNYGE